MNEITIVSLNTKERQKLKKIIKNIKVNKKRSINSDYLEKKEQQFLTQIKENKEKRIICIEENRERKLSNKTYEKLMNDYELRGNELELELSLVEKEIKKRSYFLKRLDYLYLILSFYDGVEVLSITTGEGKQKNVYINDIYNLFLNHVLDEEKERLEMEHKIMQIYMLINNMKHEKVGEGYHLYLSVEEKNNTFARILENRSEILEVDNNYNNIDKVDFNCIIIDDFFNINIDNVYKHLFGRYLKKNKKA